MTTLHLLTLERERVRKKLTSNLFGVEPQPLRVGRFEVLRRLGRGGSCIVYAAFDPELHREVAIKLLSGTVDREQMLHEARALAGLAHPNVLTVFETGVHDGVDFIITEFVHGGSLREWVTSLSERGRYGKLLSVLVQVGRGLEAAHRRGLVHRDVKPENVLMGPDDRPLVADFGLAARSSEPGTRPAGTLRYIAPEQARGGIPDPRSDQFSFCVMALELLADRCPERVKHALSKGASPAIEARYPSMTELLAALQLVRTGSNTRLAATAFAIGLVGAGVWAHSTMGASDEVPNTPTTPLNISEPLLTTERPSASPDRSMDIDRTARAASGRMLQQDYRGCAETIQDDFGSPILSALRVDCAKHLSLAELERACEAHERTHQEVPDSCAPIDLKAREHLHAGRFEACVLTIEPLPWTAQRSILISECASKWDTAEGQLRLCEFLRRHAPPPLGSPPCGGTETLEIVLRKKAGR